MQAIGQDLFPFLKFPCTLGNDVAGEVIAVGSSVTRVKVGDRVLGSAERAAFQEYTILAGNLFSPIPNNMSFEEASVILLCLSTSACSRFRTHQSTLSRLGEPSSFGLERRASVAT